MEKKVPGVQRPCSRGDGKLNAMATMTHRRSRASVHSQPRHPGYAHARTPARTHNM